ncbi:DUF6137 domain-containing protein [Sphingomonas zeae]
MASVTGDPIEEVADRTPQAVDARDWDQIIGRLEGLVDADLGFWGDSDRVVDIDALASAVLARAGPLVS